MILDEIKQANDIKNIPEEELPELAAEIRNFLVEKVSVTGGHLASNLGVVELTMALHRVFDPTVDRIIWDVGHQSYTHKLLTGRKEGFTSLRSFGGMSGFPKTSESICDPFDTGHSSTSISAGLGIARARDIKGEDYSVVSVIGDGSMTGGMAYEALNNASSLTGNFIIILNDNNMSIAPNVGGMHKYLDNVRTTDAYLDFKEELTTRLSQLKGGDHIIDALKKTRNGIKQLLLPGMLFEDLGIKYLGPIDGHNLKQLTDTLNEARKIKKPVLVHVRTVKGYGYEPAEKDPSKFHGIGPFDVLTGDTPKASGVFYTEVFSRALCVIARNNSNVCAITAAMPDGTGLNRFARAFPKRYFDVGIAEQHAVTFAAGLASQGLIPVFAVYSSFLQRAYDQLIHDVCMQNLHVVFALDRAGLVGKDGETHQGVFDLSYLTSIPNMTVLSPKNKSELIDMLQFAVDYTGPVAIRYPRGTSYEGLSEFRPPILYGRSEEIYLESDIALIAVGSMVSTADKVRKALKKRGFNCSLINARFVKPIDEEMIRKLVASHDIIVTLEDNVRNGGFGEKIANMIVEEKLNIDLCIVSLPDEFIEQGDVPSLYREHGMDAEQIEARILARFVGTDCRVK